MPEPMEDISHLSYHDTGQILGRQKENSHYHSVCPCIVHHIPLEMPYPFPISVKCSLVNSTPRSLGMRGTER